MNPKLYRKYTSWDRFVYYFGFDGHHSTWKDCDYQPPEQELKNYIKRKKEEYKDNFGWAYHNIYEKQIKVKPQFVNNDHRDAYYLMFDALHESDEALRIKRRDETIILNCVNTINFALMMLAAILFPAFFMEASILKLVLNGFFCLSLILAFGTFCMRMFDCNKDGYARYWVDHSENERINYFLAKNSFYQSKDPSGKEWRQYLYGLTPVEYVRFDHWTIPNDPAVREPDDSAIVTKGKGIFGNAINYSWKYWYIHTKEISRPKKYCTAEHKKEFELMFNYLCAVDDRIKYLSRKLDEDNYAWNFYQSGLLISCAINALAFLMQDGPIKSWMVGLFFVSLAMFAWTVLSRIVYNFKNNCWNNSDQKWQDLRIKMLIEDCPYYAGVDPLGVPWFSYFSKHRVSREQPNQNLTKEQLNAAMGIS